MLLRAIATKMVALQNSRSLGFGGYFSITISCDQDDRFTGRSLGEVWRSKKAATACIDDRFELDLFGPRPSRSQLYAVESCWVKATKSRALVIYSSRVPLRAIATKMVALQNSRSLGFGEYFSITISWDQDDRFTGRSLGEVWRSKKAVIPAVQNSRSLGFGGYFSITINCDQDGWFTGRSLGEVWRFKMDRSRQIKRAVTLLIGNSPY